MIVVKLLKLILQSNQTEFYLCFVVANDWDGFDPSQKNNIFSNQIALQL